MSKKTPTIDLLNQIPTTAPNVDAIEAQYDTPKPEAPLNASALYNNAPQEPEDLDLKDEITAEVAIGYGGIANWLTKDYGTGENLIKDDIVDLGKFGSGIISNVLDGNVIDSISNAYNDTIQQQKDLKQKTTLQQQTRFKDKFEANNYISERVKDFPGIDISGYSGLLNDLDNSHDIDEFLTQHYYNQIHKTSDNLAAAIVGDPLSLATVGTAGIVTKGLKYLPALNRAVASGSKTAQYIKGAGLYGATEAVLDVGAQKAGSRDYNITRGALVAVGGGLLGSSVATSTARKFVDNETLVTNVAKLADDFDSTGNFDRTQFLDYGHHLDPVRRQEMQKIVDVENMNKDIVDRFGKSTDEVLNDINVPKKVTSTELDPALKTELSAYASKSPEMAKLMNEATSTSSNKIKMTPDDLHYLMRRADELGYPAEIFLRQFKQESGFVHSKGGVQTTSSANAQGIAQIIPSTWNALSKTFVKKYGRLPDRNSIRDNMDMSFLHHEDAVRTITNSLNAGDEALYNTLRADPENNIMMNMMAYNGGPGAVVAAIRRANKSGQTIKTWRDLNKFVIAKETRNYVDIIGANNAKVFERDAVGAVINNPAQKLQNQSNKMSSDDILKMVDNAAAEHANTKETWMQKTLRGMTGAGAFMGIPVLKKSIAAYSDATNNTMEKALGHLISSSTIGVNTKTMSLGNLYELSTNKIRQLTARNLTPHWDMFTATSKNIAEDSRLIGETMLEARALVQNEINKGSLITTSLSDDFYRQVAKKNGLSDEATEMGFALINHNRQLARLSGNLKDIHASGIYLPITVSARKVKALRENGTYASYIGNIATQINAKLAKDAGKKINLNGVDQDLAEVVAKLKLDGISPSVASTLSDTLEVLSSKGHISQDSVDMIDELLDLGMEKLDATKNFKKSWNLDYTNNYNGVRLIDTIDTDFRTTTASYADQMAGRVMYNMTGMSKSKLTKVLTQKLNKGEISPEFYEMAEQQLKFYDGGSLYKNEKIVSDATQDFVNFLSNYGSLAFLGGSNLAAGGDIMHGLVKTMTIKARDFAKAEMHGQSITDIRALDRDFIEGFDYKPMLDLPHKGFSNIERDSAVSGAGNKVTDYLRSGIKLQSLAQGEVATFQYFNKFTAGILGAIEDKAIKNESSFIFRYINKYHGITQRELDIYKNMVTRKGWSSDGREVYLKSFDGLTTEERQVATRFLTLAHEQMTKTIQRSVAGETAPVFANGLLGKTIFKFGSFLSDAFDKRVLHNLYNADLTTLGLMAASHFGAVLSVTARLKVAEMSKGINDSNRTAEDEEKWHPGRLLVDAVAYNPMTTFGIPTFGLNPTNLTTMYLKDKEVEGFKEANPMSTSTFDITKTSASAPLLSTYNFVGNLTSDDTTPDKIVKSAQQIPLPFQSFYPLKIAKGMVPDDQREDVNNALKDISQNYIDAVDDVLND